MKVFGMQELNGNELNGFANRNAEIFGERDANIKNLGFMSYEAYLQSDLWNWIRDQLMKGTSNCCVCCRVQTGLAWHHRSYSIPVLIGNFPNYPDFGRQKIVRVCSECHFAIHTDGKKWFDLDVVDRRLKDLRDRGFDKNTEFHRDDLSESLYSFFADFASVIK